MIALPWLWQWAERTTASLWAFLLVAGAAVIGWKALRRWCCRHVWIELCDQPRSRFASRRKAEAVR